MPPYRVVGANSNRTRVEIELPFTVTGECTCDEEDQPINGREPVRISLPRFDFIPADEFKAMQDELKRVEQDDDLDQQSKDRATILRMLEMFVDDDVHALLTTRAVGELAQISSEWSRQSTMPLGELPASNGSSKNTRRQSSSTSSKPVSASAT